MGTKVTACISFDPEFLKMIDDKRGLVSRSAFVNDILKKDIDLQKENV